MKKNLMNLIKMIFIISCTVYFNSCTSMFSFFEEPTISITEKAPAKLDLTNIKTISFVGSPFCETAHFYQSSDSILSFISNTFFTSTDADYKEHLDFVKFLNEDTMNSLKNIKNLNYVQQNGDLEVRIYVDKLSCEIRKTQDFNEDYYKKECSTTLKYEIVETSTNEIIISKEISGSNSNLNKRKGDLSEEKTILSSISKEFIGKIFGNFEEHNIFNEFILMEITSETNNSKSAKKLVKDKKYLEAANIYKNIYSITKDKNACFNSAILFWSVKNYDEAQNLINEFTEEDYKNTYYGLLKMKFKESIESNAN